MKSEVIIKTEFIKLDQFLKLASIASSGGEAKNIILFNEVYINDVLIKERGRKVRPGDSIKVVIDKSSYEIIVKSLLET